MEVPKTKKDRIETLKEVLYGLFFLLVFAIFPILVLQISTYKIEELEIAQSIADSSLHHQRIIGKIKQADDYSEMVGRSIKKVFQAICATENQHEKIQRIKYLKRSFPEVFDLYIFSADGKLIKEFSSDRHPGKAIELALFALKEFSARVPRPNMGRTGVLKSIIGLTELPAALRVENLLYRLGNRKKDSHIIWGTSSGGESETSVQSYLALLHSENFDDYRALELSVDWINNRYSNLQAGFLNLENPTDPFYPARLENYSDLSTGIFSTHLKFEKTFVATDYFCTFARRKLSEYIFIIQKKPRFFSQTMRFLINIACLLWFIIVFKNLPIHGRKIRGKITAKLVFLFLFAIGIPSAILLIGGFYALKDHSRVLQQELQSKIVNKLNQFDEMYPEHLANLSDYLQKIVREANQVENLDTIRSILAKTREKKHLFMYGFLIDENGDIFFKLHGKHGSNMMHNRKIVLLVGRELVARLNKSLKVDSGTLMMEATEDFFSSIGGKNFDFNNLIKEMGKFLPMSFGSEGSYLFATAIYDNEGKARYACVFVANRPTIARNFILRNIDSLTNQEEFSWKVNAIGISPLARDILKTPELKNRIKQITANLIARNTPVKEIQATGTNQLLWYAKKCAYLEDYALVVTTSLNPLQKQIQRKWYYLLLLALTIFIITTIIGLALSNQFLTPIKNITHGVKAIEKRNFDLTIPVTSQDELGNLSQLLNTVMEGMKDLQVASIVQSSLFPGETLHKNGIEIFGKSRAMTDIGGDYFDYYLADDSRIIGLVGDVSGHGISAALIMGMAKYAFTTKEAADRPLNETLEAFNLYLIKNIKRKKMMTMFLYSLDLESFRLEYSCAGHNSPLILPAQTRKASMLDLQSFPLGIRKKARYQNFELQIQPGDQILLYTDGLVEATDKSNNVIGYQTALDWFESCQGLSAQQTIEKLFELYDMATSGQATEDDISMIALQRDNKP